MKKSCIVLILLLTGLCSLGQMGRPSQAEAGAVKTIVCYVPNRVFDLMDILRLRVRVGPGISAGVRATRPLSAYLGLHSTFFIGLPGPRETKRIPWPLGLDLRAGAQASIADASSGTPYYDPLEVGFEVQPLLVGVNVGIGVFEIFDFFTGLICIDLQGDDFGKPSKKDDSEKDLNADETVEKAEEESAPSEGDKKPAEEVDEAAEEPAPSEGDKEPAEEVDETAEESAPSESDKEPTEEKNE